MKAQKRSAAPCKLNLASRWRWVVKARSGRFTAAREHRYRTEVEVGTAPEPVWTYMQIRKISDRDPNTAPSSP
jgi:hypothetical protein